VIDKALYESDFKVSIKTHHLSRITLLKGVPFFSKWTKTTLAKFSYYLKRVQLFRNQVLYKEGEPCKSIYIVISGEFEVRKKIKGFYERIQAAERAK
jgi:hypothetical protein